ncbi:unnamed protein product [Euphydryas editha]|uniref:Uncharacterized protein n=1 Tax=Euphydryas editha TaxID=104508 RepID=A0AAU9UFT5_EUPED|nr:unnamed protein product [Euphydryas editha]
MSIVFQVLSTAIVNFGGMIVGIFYTWPSSTIGLFTSPNTPLNRVMTETEISFLGSLPSISAIIVTPFVGIIIDSLGRKWSCIVFSLIQLASWVIITTCARVEVILFAMFVCGLSSCMFIVVTIYVGEFCENSVRGSMVSATMIFFGTGMLVSYLMGGLLDYKTMNYVGLSLTVLGLVLLSTIKESPLYLLKYGREQVKHSKLLEALPTISISDEISVPAVYNYILNISVTKDQDRGWRRRKHGIERLENCIQKTEEAKKVLKQLAEKRDWLP